MQNKGNGLKLIKTSYVTDILEFNVQKFDKTLKRF